MGTSVRGSQLWLVAGDEITGTIDKIGTPRHKVEAAPAPPAGTGLYLPPVSTYRKPGGAAAGNSAPGGRALDTQRTLTHYFGSSIRPQELA